MYNTASHLVHWDSIYTLRFAQIELEEDGISLNTQTTIRFQLQDPEIMGFSFYILSFNDQS